MEGTVKSFYRLKGLGFIEPDDGGSEVAVHYSAIEGEGYRNLYQGDRVRFDVYDREKGRAAKNVRVIARKQTESYRPIARGRAVRH